jgi:hypothetical protein
MEGWVALSCLQSWRVYYLLSPRQRETKICLIDMASYLCIFYAFVPGRMLTIPTRIRQVSPSNSGAITACLDRCLWRPESFSVTVGTPPRNPLWSASKFLGVQHSWKCLVTVDWNSHVVDYKDWRWSSRFLRNIGTYLPHYTTLLPRKHRS